jgi:SagB-type dehydrogenase family enzyme
VGLRQLHPTLLVHTMWLAGRRRLVAQASASRPPLILNDPLGLSALGALPPEFDRESAVTAWRASGIPEEAHGELWAAFDAAGLFAEASSNGATWWDEFHWREARAYHESTRDYPFLQMNEPGAFASDAERMHEYRDEEPSPPVYQRLGGGTVVELPGLSADENPDERLQGLSVDDRLGLEGIGLLLDVCFGERGRIGVADGSTCLLKSIPSGGARHPTELFLAVFELPGIAAGAYHYDVEHHHLELVRAGQQRDAFAHATLDLFTKYDAPPAAALLFTSRVERAMWRYRDPRSFRAILVDVGHAVTAYRHVARLLGFRTYAYGKMRDGEVAALLGVDGVAQPPLYVGTLVP